MSKFFKKTFIKLKPEITSGVCPHCEDISSFVSIVNDNYRCMNCGSDLQQHVNGKITYLPVMTSRDDGGVPFVKEWTTE